MSWNLTSSFLFLRWKNYWIRGVLSLAMISGFFLIIYLGPITLILVVSIVYYLIITLMISFIASLIILHCLP
jgi:hypothetical protein